MNYAAVIIETRDLKGLRDVIDNHRAFIPKEWHTIVYGSELNFASVPEGCIFVNIHTTKISFNDYNRMLTSKAFWKDLIGFDRVLIFQHDSKMLRCCIDPFLEYDYVGAPWKWDSKRLGGNGGLSIRNPAKMIELIEKLPYDTSYGNEDVYFSHHLHKVNGNIAPFEVAKTFSVETIFHESPIGIHAAHKHLTHQQMKAIERT